MAEYTLEKWQSRIADAKKRDKDFLKQAEMCYEIYRCDETSKVPFNILFSNTDTILPALYNETPMPQVSPKAGTHEPLAILAGRVAERMLTYQLDQGNPLIPTCDELMTSAVLEALVAGRSLIRYFYDAEFTPDASGIVSEYVRGEVISYNRFYHSEAAVWSDVRWVAFLTYLTKAEAKAAKLPDDLQFTYSRDDSKQGDLAAVWEIWCRDSGKVYILAEGYKKFLRPPQDDPLGLVGFFPCTPPLRFFDSGRLDHYVCHYEVYRTQAQELNLVTQRIKAVVGALKVRGAYDGSVEELSRVATAGDNEFISVQNAQGLYDTAGGLEKAIWVWPIERLVGILQQLYSQRREIKAVIDELTGISDIIRGSTAASETATAQGLKNRWGVLRLKRWQKMVALYVEQGLRLQLELCVTSFNLDTVAKIVQLEIPKSAAEVDPQQPQPSLEEVLELLKQDSVRNFLVQIRTNSTVAEQLSEDRADASEFLGAFSQLVQGTAPLIERGVLSEKTARVLLMHVARMFSVGREFEKELGESVDQSQEEQKPKEPTPEEIKAKLEMQMLEGEVALKQKEGEMRLRQLELSHEIEMLKLKQAYLELTGTLPLEGELEPEGEMPQEIPPEGLPPEGLPPEQLPPEQLPPEGLPPETLPPQGYPQ